jgi:hypothetical protein
VSLVARRAVAAPALIMADYRIGAEERARFKRCRRQWDFASPHCRQLEPVGAADPGNGTAGVKTLLASQSPMGFVGWGLFYGVVCREQAAFTDAKSCRPRRRPPCPTSPTGCWPSCRNKSFSAGCSEDCAVWDVGRADPRAATQTRSDVPTLLTWGSFDAATAPRWAPAAAEGLPKDPATDKVLVEVTAFSRHATWWSRLGAPATSLAQRVVMKRYLTAL